ncbi:MAG: hypothetical protein ABIJ61_00065 [bacterium]
MTTRVLLASVLLLGLLCGPTSAQDNGIRDTVSLGLNHQAWLYPNDQVCVPVYITSDANLTGVQIGMEYGFDGYEIHLDSVGTFATIFMEGNFLSLTGLIYVEGYSDGINPDSVLIGGAGLGNGDELPIGRYLLGKVWFNTVDPGPYLTLDSAFVLPVGEFMLAPKNGSPFVPQYVGGTLTLVPGPAEIYVIDPEPPVGDAASLIIFEVEALATYAPAAIVLDSVVNSLSGAQLPYVPGTLGSNPITVEWTPTYEEFGFFQFWFTATDALSNPLSFSVQVTVNWVQPPCDVMRGDTNCDETVNITDVVYLIQYIFNQGPPPGCIK